MFSRLFNQNTGVYKIFYMRLQKFDSMKPFETNLLKSLLAKIKLINFEIKSDIEKPQQNKLLETRL